MFRWLKYVVTIFCQGVRFFCFLIFSKQAVIIVLLEHIWIKNSIYIYLPFILQATIPTTKDAGCQTKMERSEKRAVGTQLSRRTLQTNVRSKGVYFIFNVQDWCSGSLSFTLLINKHLIQLSIMCWHDKLLTLGISFTHWCLKWYHLNLIYFHYTHVQWLKPKRTSKNVHAHIIHTHITTIKSVHVRVQGNNRCFISLFWCV